MRKIALMLSALTLAAASLPATALPPAAGGALASDNVDLVATLPDAPAIGARILERDGHKFMYVTTGLGVRIYDVTAGMPVLLGALPLPHLENEDVDTNGDILLISADSFLSFPAVVLYVVDVSDPRHPALLSVREVPTGHTVTCIESCKYAWLAGETTVSVLDLTDPTDVKDAGSFAVPVRGGTHDVQVDESGIAWVSAGGGLFGYRTDGAGTPSNPELVYSAPNGTQGAFHNNFIIHNSWRPDALAATPTLLADSNIDEGEVVLVTEENYDPAGTELCQDEGQFQTGWVRAVDGKPVVERLDKFTVSDGTDPGVSDGDHLPTAAVCSSHYFSEVDGIVAIGWYEQGTRFLDVSDPRNIRQIGYFLPAATATWSALTNKVGDDLFVYTIDVVRGIDVLRFSGEAGDATQLAPRLNAPSLRFAPSPKWGYACRVMV